MTRNFILTLSSLLLFCGVAHAEADGPDTWAVTSVEINDVLNIRAEADANSPKVGEIPADGIQIQNLGCNEKNFTGWVEMDIPAREKVMNLRWCQVEYQGVKGWVRGKFLKGE